MQTGLWENRKIACGVMVALILIGTLLGGLSGVKRMQKRTAECFENGVDGDGYGIRGDLNVIASEGHSLLTLCSKYLPSESSEAIAASAARETLLYSNSPAELYRAAAAFYTNLEILYRRAVDLIAEDDKKTQMTKWFGDIQEANLRIRGNGYNDVAKAYNEKLRQFPVFLYAALLHISDAELYA